MPQPLRSILIAAAILGAAGVSVKLAGPRAPLLGLLIAAPFAVSMLLREQKPPKRLPSMSQEEALSILGLTHRADGTAIREAHRRLIRRVHPDAGGNAEHAMKINRARDVLLGS